MKLATISQREAILDAIKVVLIKQFNSKILCAIAYGSALNKDFSYNSDFDILIVAKDPDVQLLEKLRRIKFDWLSKGIRIDFNVHSETDIPSIRKELFWHNNRGIYVQKELELYGKVLIGKNVFKIEKIDIGQILTEAARVINSLNYQARKTLINSDLKDNDKILLMKWCIYGSLYALASRGVFPSDRKSALQKFYEIFKPPINPERFLHIKVNRPNEISREDLEMAYEFLTYLDKRIFEDYENFKSSH
jgi:predicted nucleotidyltransferase